MRAIGVLVLLGALASLVAVAAPSAAAAASCGKKVLDDWYDGRIDGSYPLHCYDDAIEIIPRDVRDYSSAQEDIERALQARLRNEEAPANADPAPAATTTDPVGEPAETTGEGTARGPDDPVDPSGGEAAGTVEAENVSSVPIPLLVLAALALLLVLGGSAGYLVRRYQARRIPPPAA